VWVNAPEVVTLGRATGSSLPFHKTAQLLAWRLALPKGKSFPLPLQQVKQLGAESVEVWELLPPMLGKGVEGEPNEILREIVKRGFFGSFPSLPKSVNQGCHRLTENVFGIQFLCGEGERG
jgi:hypothetical protein